MAILCISRGTFSGGEAVAESVAKQLDYPCLSRERNVATAAARYGLSADVLTATLDKRPSYFDKILRERDVYLLCLRATLFEAAQSGKLVYHGYLGQLLLPEVAPILRVRIIADLSFRMRAVRDTRGLSEPEAQAYIAHVDRQRRDWIRFLFGVDWEAPSHYDLVLNLSRVPLEAATATIVSLAQQPEFQGPPLSALADQALRYRVLAALAIDHRTRGAVLEVTAHAGTVTVAGTTSWHEVQEAVPLVVHEVPGVNEVRTDITGVRPLHPLNFY